MSVFVSSLYILYPSAFFTLSQDNSKDVAFLVSKLRLETVFTLVDSANEFEIKPL